MAKAFLNLAGLMGSRNISISYTPFNPDVIVIKRASFPKGVVPEHLRPHLIPPGTGAGIKGTAVYKGRKIPKTAIHIAMTRGSKGRKAQQLPFTEFD